MSEFEMINRPAALPDNDSERIALQNEVRRLELELEACQHELIRLRSELESARLSRAEMVGELVSSQTEMLFQQAAAPVSQYITQAYLLETAGKPLQAKDVAAVTRRLVTALQNAGLTIEGQPGQMTGFDPDRHSPLNSSAVPEPGQRVVIRFVGVSYEGRLLQRAGVEPAEEAV